MKTIAELLTGREVVSTPGHTTVLEAAQLMGDKKIGALLILDENCAPVGIFTERDLMLRVVKAGLDPQCEIIADHMTRNVFFVSPERTVSDAAYEIQQRHIRHLPVVSDGRVIALLSLRDLLRDLLLIKRQEVQALTAYIQGDDNPPEAEFAGE